MGGDVRTMVLDIGDQDPVVRRCQGMGTHEQLLAYLRTVKRTAWSIIVSCI